MTIDVALTGPVFLDLTFEGLQGLPEPERERFASALHQTPGGAAITAVGLARLGLRAAILTPLGADPAGRTLRKLLEAEGVVCAGGESERSAVTVVLPLDGERAMITFQPEVAVDFTVLEELRPGAVVAGIDQLSQVSYGGALYAIVGDRDAERFAQSTPPGLDRARAVLTNASEATRLTGETTPEAAARALAQHAGEAVVSLGARGAVAASGDEVLTVPAPQLEARDTTGAGDLLAAAYVWADLNGLPLEERLRRAVVYAALSVRTATGAGSAATLDELGHALTELDPALVQAGPAKEDA